MADINKDFVYDDPGTRGAWHLADNPSEYQPVRQANFKFVVGRELMDLLREQGAVDGIDDSVIAGTQNVLTLSVFKFDAPHFNQKVIEIERENSKIYFAGKPEWTSGAMEIYDFAGAGSKPILESWQQLSYDRDSDGIPNSKKYKINCQVIEYLPDHTFVKYWDLYGCWVEKLGESGYDWTSGEKKTVQATIRFDKAVPRYVL